MSIEPDKPQPQQIIEAPLPTPQAGPYLRPEEMIASLEAERRRLAIELEQSLGASISLLLAQAKMYEQSLANNPTAQMAVSVLATLGRQSLQQLRDIIAKLYPSILTDLGLEAALENLTVQLNRIYGVHFNLNLKRSIQKLPAQTALVLYQAIQEVLEQLITTTQARNITLQTRYSEEKFKVQILSNGLLSLTPDSFPEMSERLAWFGAEFRAEQALDGRYCLYFVVSMPPRLELTPRELEVLGHLARGQNDKQIAQALKLSPRTINFHLNNIYAKFEVNSRTEAVLAALRYGLISPTR